MEGIINLKTQYLMGGIGNKLFQLNNSWDDPNTIYVDIDKFPKFIRKLIPIKQHVDWLKISKLISEFRRLERTPNILDFIFLMLIYAYRRLVKKSDVQILNMRLGYFQKKQISSEFMINFQQFCVSSNIITSRIEKVTSEDSIVVHARGLDFGRDIRLDSKILETLNAKTVVYLVGDDRDFKSIISEKYDVKLVGGSVIDDFNTISNAEFLLASSSTFAFWAAISNDPESKRIHPKSGSIFKFHEHIFHSIQ